MEIILIGFLTGLAGSLHCVGMCGPLAIAVPAVNNNLFLSKFFYNSGRVFTYTLMGLCAGLIGERIYLDKFQSYFSIISGIILLAGLVLYLNQKRLLQIKFLSEFLGFLKNEIAIFFKIKTYKSVLITGILNGLLPCGMIYIALSGAVITGNSISGMFYMMFFGLGTFPLMMGISVYGVKIKNFIGRKINYISPALITIVAILLLLRGLNLGIPVISPEVKKNNNTEILICE
ncbi:MAG: sulfite exporter TauE/SafE family protein [Ignavibacteria bacterium]|nr:sulfite exporter TauE/SafE family protein [Ignavibacteria bacterium]